MRGCAQHVRAGRLWSDEYLKDVAGGWTRWRGRNLSWTLSHLGRGHFSRSHPLPYMPQTLSINGGTPRELVGDVTIPPPLNCLALTSVSAVMWLNEGGETSKLHYDTVDQLLMQVDGVKELVLIDPIDSLTLYKDHAPGVYGSPLDLRQVDLSRYPAAAHATIYTVQLTPGDVLYLPSYWWHIVDSLPRRDPETCALPPAGRNLMISLQFGHNKLLVGPDSRKSASPTPTFSHDVLAWALAMRGRSAACEQWRREWLSSSAQRREWRVWRREWGKDCARSQEDDAAPAAGSVSSSLMYHICEVHAPGSRHMCGPQSNRNRSLLTEQLRERNSRERPRERERQREREREKTGETTHGREQRAGERTSVIEKRVRWRERE